MADLYMKANKTTLIKGFSDNVDKWMALGYVAANCASGKTGSSES